MIGRRKPKDVAAGAGAAAVAVLVGGMVLVAVEADRAQKALLASGQCRAVTEALYTPPPTAHQSCYGGTDYAQCSTYYTQSDPYFRTLWRCTDASRGGKLVEFWRRSTDEARP